MELNCDHPDHHFPLTDRFWKFIIREGVPPLTHCCCGQCILVPDASLAPDQIPVRPEPADGPLAVAYQQLLAGEPWQEIRAELHRAQKPQRRNADRHLRRKRRKLQRQSRRYTRK